MKKYLRKTLIYFSFLILLFLGLIGLALPLVPQTIFFILALVLISFEAPWIEKKFKQFLKKSPVLSRFYYKFKNKLKQFLS